MILLSYDWFYFNPSSLQLNFLHNLGQIHFCKPCITVLEGILEFKILCQISKTLIEKRLKFLNEKNTFADKTITDVGAVVASNNKTDDLPQICEDPSSPNNELIATRTYTRTLSKSVIKGLPFICAHCGKHISGRSDIKYHVIKRHLNGTRCPIKRCRAAFLTSIELSNHLASHEIKKKNFALRSITCSICNLTTTMSNRKNACEHLKPKKKSKTSKPTPCDVCGKTYKTKSQLGEHQRSVHGNYVFGCNVCGAKFKSKNNLRTHISSVHGPRLKCSYCGIKMAGPRSLTVHINSVHLNKRSCVCKECGATFHATAALKKHMHIHYNTRPWNCDICQEQGYYSTEYLRKHYLRVHQLDYTLEEVRHHSIKVTHSYK